MKRNPTDLAALYFQGRYVYRFNNCVYLPKNKLVFDRDTYKLYKTSEFIAEVKREIDEEYAHQLRHRNILQEATQIYPFEVTKDTKEYVNDSIEASEKRVVIWQRRILRAKFTKDGDENLDIKAATEVPITDLIEFNNAGFATCIWHNEKTPSMKYNSKKNRVHCFGCGEDHDAIDVVQKLNNVSFVEAVKFLNRR